MKKLMLLALALPFVAHANSRFLQGISFFSPRSQTADLVRYQTGSHPYTHQHDANGINGLPFFRVSHSSLFSNTIIPLQYRR